ncbi:hypothetical protein [Microbispora sp. H13382]|uniref:hypothetical protein n=1 Tax=Microbispora sp. H13382 TaxID=2729112 RepID=UPI0016035163|nr:hypothetical protein [Microbispora sp. H13382]
MTDAVIREPVGRHRERVPFRATTSRQNIAVYLALVAGVALVPLGILDWLVAMWLVRGVQCGVHEQGGVLDCGGSSALEKAILFGSLLALPMFVVETWLIARGIRRIAAGREGNRA